MGFAAFYFDSVLHLPSSSSSGGLKFRTPILSFSRREYSNSSDGNPHPVPKKTLSSNMEDILAIFKQMQTSISKGHSRYSRPAAKDDVFSPKSPSNPATDVTSVESILEVLHRRPREGKTSSKQGDERWASLLPGGNVSSNYGCEVWLKEEHKEEFSFSSQMDVKSRPPSSFSRRSPIPTRNKVDVNSEEALDLGLGLITKNFEGMKLAQLKQVAKSKGLKGYSKLTKMELVQLLTKSSC